MAIAYILTPEIRRKLKKPIGKLICGSFTETMRKLEEMVKEENPPCIISVGDTVSRNLMQQKISPNLAIVDNKAMRKSIRPIRLATEETIHVKNTQGTITQEAITAIQDSLKIHGHSKIVVDGEEDLLTLIAVLYAPEDSLVIYGQPYEGIVVVKTTSEKKAEINEVLKVMENVRKTK